MRAKVLRTISPSNSGAVFAQEVPVMVNSIRRAPAAGPRETCPAEYRNMKRAARYLGHVFCF